MPHTARHGSNDDGDDGSDGSDGGDSGGGGGGGGSAVWGNIAPQWLQDLSQFGDILATFASNPRNFIVGAVATTILETVFGIVSFVINQIVRIFLGTAPGSFNAPGETLGLADVPFAIIEPLLGAGGDVGSQITGAIESLNEPIFALAGSAGPLSPLIIVTAVVIEAVAVVWLLQRLALVVLDFVPGGGGLIE